MGAANVGGAVRGGSLDDDEANEAGHRSHTHTPR